MLQEHCQQVHSTCLGIVGGSARMTKARYHRFRSLRRRLPTDLPKVSSASVHSHHSRHSCCRPGGGFWIACAMKDTCSVRKSTPMGSRPGKTSTRRRTGFDGGHSTSGCRSISTIISQMCRTVGCEQNSCEKCGLFQLRSDWALARSGEPFRIQECFQNNT